MCSAPASFHFSHSLPFLFSLLPFVHPSIHPFIQSFPFFLQILIVCYLVVRLTHLLVKFFLFFERSVFGLRGEKTSRYY